MKKKVLSLTGLLFASLVAWAFIPHMPTDPSREGENAEGIDYLQVTGETSQVVVTPTGNNSYKLETTGGDNPFVTLSALQTDWGESLSYIAFEYTIDQDAECNLQFFPQTAGSSKRIALHETGSWKQAMVDIESVRTELGWGKAGDSLRLNFDDQAVITMEIRNIKPASENDYQAFEAQEILDVVPDPNDYENFPNFSKELRKQLQDALDAYRANPSEENLASMNEAKGKAKECQKAYIYMVRKANEFLEYVDEYMKSELTDAQFAEMENANDLVWAAFVDGTYSTEEALSLKDLKAVSYYETVFGSMPEHNDSTYLVANAAQMMWVARYVNEGHGDINITLTDDIDMSSMPGIMIADNRGSAYSGTLDGQDHTIRMALNVTNTGDYSGALIRFACDATIKNLHLTGSVATLGKHCGSLISYAYGNTTLEGVTSDTDNYTNAGDACLGGLIGIAGENWRGCPDANIYIHNCAFTGTLNHTGVPEDNCGGCFVGWKGFQGAVTVANCYAIPHGEIVNPGNVYSFVRNKPGDDARPLTIKDCYTAENTGVGNIQGKVMTEDQFTSGEVTFLLNGSSAENPGWYQNIGEDNLPVLDSTHGVVVGMNGMYASITDEASVTDAAIQLSGSEMEYAEGLEANETMLDNYKASIEAIGESKTLAELTASISEALAWRAQVEKNIELYAEYAAKAGEILGKLEGDLNAGGLKLRSYLSEDFEPNDDFANGSVSYICTNYTLDNDQLQQEIAFMEDMYMIVASEEVPAGSDVTVLLTNPSFTDGFNGWESHSGNAVSSKSLAECWNNTGEWSQTVTGLRNGIYEIRMNAGYRTDDSDDPTFYNAYLFSGDNQVPVMLYKEDGVLFDDAKSGENCYSGESTDWPYDRIYHEEMYTPTSTTGAHIAFAAGRYKNSILVKVTDGTLTFGIRSLGGPRARDWVTFGNTKLIYWGEPDEATDGLQEVLAGQTARAHTILGAQVDAGANYDLYPNFSNTLRAELQSAIEAAEQKPEGEEAYQLIEKFSGLFTSIRDCQMAYIGLMSKADALTMAYGEALSCGAMTDEELGEKFDALANLSNIFEEGSATAEEIRNMNFFDNEKDGDYYTLASMMDYITFAGLVNGGDTSACAKLLNDIDISPLTTLVIANDGSKPFRGTFDGQGHTLNIGFDLQNTGDYSGALIRFAQDATIRNLHLTGSITTRGKHCGSVVCYAYGHTTLENVTSSTTNSTNAGDACLGGLVGIAGENWNGCPLADIIIRNCAFTGSLTNTGNPDNHNGGCIVGWKGFQSTVSVENCYAAPHGELTAPQNVFSFVRYWDPGDNHQWSVENCYVIADTNIGNIQGTVKTAEQFASGEVCYLLNGDQSNIAWYQNLGTDDYPVLDNTHGTVIANGDGTYGTFNAIESVVESSKPSSATYNLMGQKVSKARKGIYIISGRKVLVK